MNLMIELFCFIVLIHTCLNQSITRGTINEIVLYESYTTSYMTFSGSGSFTCLLKDITNSVDKFCNVTFTASGSRIDFGNLQIGRSRGYDCSDSTGLIASGNIIVRPNIKAFVCDIVRTTYLPDSNVTVDVTITFGNPLPSPGLIACDNGVLAKPQPVPISASSIKVPISYAKLHSGADQLNCNFTWNSITSNFVISILAVPQQISLFPAVLTTSDPRIQINLNSNFKPLKDLTVNCSVFQFNSLLNCSNLNTGVASNWIVTSPITLKAITGDTSAVLYLSNPSLNADNATVQQLSLICCGVNQDLQAQSKITYNRPALFSSVMGYSSETSYPDIKYFPLSKCPCDLTVDECDLNCCCDGFCDCSSSASSAIPGPFGGNSLTQAASNQHNCSTMESKILANYPYLSLLCLEYESSSIIGDYWLNQNITSDPILIGQKLANGRIANPGFEFITSTSSSASSSSSSPTSSSSSASSLSVETIPASTSTFSNLPSLNILTLPGQPYNQARCNPQFPVYLFQNSLSKCVVSVTPSSCVTATASIQPQIHPRLYLVSTSALTRTCADQLAISSIGTGNTPIFTFYQCDATVDCTFDNGFVIPELTNNINSNCSNVVKSVQYRIFMNNSEIVFVESTITLTTVLFNTPELTQTFSVNFISKSFINTTSPISSLSYNQLLNLYADVLSPATSLAASSIVSNKSPFLKISANAPGALPTTNKKSGLYGYDNGKPIITVQDTSATTPKFQNIKLLPMVTDCPPDSTDPNTLPDSLFGTSSVNYCSYKLTNTDFTNCTKLATKLKGYVDLFTPYDNVAVYGNPEDPSDYVKIVKENTTSISDRTLDSTAGKDSPINKIESVCTNVIFGSVITIFYSRQGRVRNQYILNIRGVKREYLYRTILKSTPDLATGLPATMLIQIKVNYQLTPASNLPATVSTAFKQSDVCQYDICVNDLLYPWAYEYEGKTGLYEQAYGVVLLGFAVFLLVVTYPWW